MSGWSWHPNLCDKRPSVRRPPSRAEENDLDRYSLRTRKWLDLRFDPSLVELVGHHYEPYQPVYGVRPEKWTLAHFMMAVRWAWLTEALRSTGADSFLDVGGAEGYVAQLVRSLHTSKSCSTDLSISACERAHEFFSVGTLASEAHRLPFEDNAFSVVYCAEVIEHLAHPVETLLELKRVARDVVIVASEEGVRDEAARAEELGERALSDHMDRSIICATDFELLFPGWDARVYGLCSQLPTEVPQSSTELVASIAGVLRFEDFRSTPEATGMIAVLFKDAGPGEFGSTVLSSVRDVIEFAFDRSAVVDRTEPTLHEAYLPTRICVKCGAPVELLANATCAACGVVYSNQKTTEDFVLQRESDSTSSLEDKLNAEFPNAPERVAAGLTLQKLMDFPLSPSISTRQLPLELDAGWTACDGGRLTAHAESGLVLECDAHDPCLFSPELNLNMDELKGVRVALEVSGLSSEEEIFQVFFRTLNRPLWWEQASVTEAYRTANGPYTFELELPDAGLFGENDILTGLRIDPSNHSSNTRILSVEFL